LQNGPYIHLLDSHECDMSGAIISAFPFFYEREVSNETCEHIALYIM